MTSGIRCGHENGRVSPAALFSAASLPHQR
jgi:hypothetical protein